MDDPNNPRLVSTRKSNRTVTKIKRFSPSFSSFTNKKGNRSVTKTPPTLNKNTGNIQFGFESIQTNNPFLSNTLTQNHSPNPTNSNMDVNNILSRHIRKTKPIDYKGLELTLQNNSDTTFSIENEDKAKKVAQKAQSSHENEGNVLEESNVLESVDQEISSDESVIERPVTRRQDRMSEEHWNSVFEVSNNSVELSTITRRNSQYLEEELEKHNSFAVNMITVDSTANKNTPQDDIQIILIKF